MKLLLALLLFFNSVSVGFNGAPSFSGSLNMSDTNGSSSWTTQSSIQTLSALQVNVGSETKLVGAMISSASKDLYISTGSLVTSDLRDYNQLSTNGFSVSVSTSALPTFSLNVENKDKQGVTRATIGAGTVVVRDLTSAETDALLAKLNRDPANFAEVLVDIHDVLKAEINLQNLKDLPDNLKAVGNMLAALAAPIPSDLSPTEADYFRRLIASGKTPEQVYIDLDDPKIKEFIRQKENLDDLKKKFPNGIPPELKILVLKGIQVDVIDGDGDWRSRVVFSSGCSVDAGNGPCDSQVVRNALAFLEKNIDKIGKDALSNLKDPALNQAALQGDFKAIQELNNAFDTIKACVREGVFFALMLPSLF